MHLPDERRYENGNLHTSRFKFEKQEVLSHRVGTFLDDVRSPNSLEEHFHDKSEDSIIFQTEVGSVIIVMCIPALRVRRPLELTPNWSASPSTAEYQPWNDTL
jgi:hypothetical protein